MDAALSKMKIAPQVLIAGGLTNAIMILRALGW